MAPEPTLAMVSVLRARLTIENDANASTTRNRYQCVWRGSPRAVERLRAGPAAGAAGGGGRRGGRRDLQSTWLLVPGGERHLPARDRPGWDRLRGRGLRLSGLDRE